MAYHDQLTEAFDLRIDAIGPNFGTEALLDAVADSAGLATLVGTAALGRHLEATRPVTPAEVWLPTWARRAFPSR